MLHRRDLFRLGVGAGALAAVGGCGASGGNGGPVKGSTTVLPSSDLEEATIAGLQQRMGAGKATAVSLVAAYRARIDATNTTGPELRAVIELNPDAEANAAKLDAERKAGTLRGPLHGIPVLVKDNIDTGDKMQTTAGSLALAGTRAEKDAAVVAKLRAAGAVILGKANLSEWANIRGKRSSSGWSARGGQCRNPYAIDRSPSGSSSGSGAATAASLCAAAIGTETDGSITSPASCTALVGMKPTVGLVSRAGIIPISASQDTAGPMARAVADAAALLSAIVDKPEDFTKYLSPGALNGARIGVPRKGWFGSRNVDPVAEAALVALKQLGAVLVDPIELEAPSGPLKLAELEVLLYELKDGMAAYLGARGADTKVRSLADVIAWNKAHAGEELALFGQELFEQAQTKGPLTDKAYLEARALCVKSARDEGIDKVMDANKLDAIFAMTSGPAWLIDHVNGDSFAPPYAPPLAAIAGYPHVTVPAGSVQGLPVGMSLFGRANSDGKLLGYAYAFEQATKHRKAPKLTSR